MAPPWWNRIVDVASLLLELYGRIPPLARDAIDGVELARLTEPPTPGANTIAWLVWHLTRVQDDHVAELLGAPQVWVGGGWARHFGLEPDPSNTGYGHTAEEVAAVQPTRPEVLLEYLEAVDGRTRTMLENLTPADLDRIIDRRWDPPVTLGVRLVSIADDCLQHLGQAAYARGLLRP
jgi:DinB superfamily